MPAPRVCEHRPGAVVEKILYFTEGPDVMPSSRARGAAATSRETPCVAEKEETRRDGVEEEETVATPTSDEPRSVRRGSTTARSHGAVEPVGACASTHDAFRARRLPQPTNV